MAPDITVYTVPGCADCEAVKRLLKGKGAAFTEKNVREDPAALAEMQARAGVRIAPVTVIGEQVFSGYFDDQRPGLLAALEAAQ
ncbi:glutaredoxin family protein [Deinococcus radiopugnans]|uniref:Glutaredoxin n=1 Tax=Deinococcus radiopugnans ATCC 19172 TaxID=585398 RepID=A0A5C4XVX2_9DEIO|nr:glutaredoxin family protein [Deinococcus radiopugnans]MBB6018427.1 glutaredoxin [Deinococcus radiopugnans ATCC 19172]TNM67563.1 glutaredoxin family protein [Deinococcus radiopugnans ATCC 19172]